MLTLKLFVYTIVIFLFPFSSLDFYLMIQGVIWM
ncbi:hypothetical protein OIU77_030614 [Salix suchowensis]|uniref:NADH dehydrogenase subunit 4 n=1 Tax=Salix suchowensis TaxID=1278906 RepID=A0ABQ9BCK8_9ROSI|nr:hypothetical protein OIU77_030614 [Salix suchowensis]